MQSSKKRKLSPVEEEEERPRPTYDPSASTRNRLAQSTIPPLILQDKKSIILKADEASIFNQDDSSNLSDVTFNLNGVDTAAQEGVLYRTICVDYCYWVNSVYTVNYSNSTLVVSDVSYTVPEANYDAPTLLNYLSLVLNGITPTVSILTGVVTFFGTTAFTIGGASSMLLLLGGSAGTTYSSDVNYEITMPRPMNMLTTQLLRFACPSLPLQGYFGSSQRSFLITIPNTAGAFTANSYINSSSMGQQVLPQHLEITTLRIQVFNEEGVLVDFNSVSWTLALSITTYRAVNIDRPDFFEITNAALDEAEADDLDADGEAALAALRIETQPEVKDAGN